MKNGNSTTLNWPKKMVMPFPKQSPSSKSKNTQSSAANTSTCSKNYGEAEPPKSPPPIPTAGK